MEFDYTFTTATYYCVCPTYESVHKQTIGIGASECFLIAIGVAECWTTKHRGTITLFNSAHTWRIDAPDNENTSMYIHTTLLSRCHHHLLGNSKIPSALLADVIYVQSMNTFLFYICVWCIWFSEWGPHLQRCGCSQIRCCTNPIVFRSKSMGYDPMNNIPPSACRRTPRRMSLSAFNRSLCHRFMCREVHQLVDYIMRRSHLGTNDVNSLQHKPCST